MLTSEELKSLLKYDKESGVFVWLVNRHGQKVAGTIAGTIDQDGYRMIKVRGKKYNAGYLAWLYEVGRHPVAQVDHKNLVRDDNRFDNLREATLSQNMMNRNLKLGKNNKFKGVKFHKKTGRWAARIQVNKNPIFIGYFPTEVDAAMAYDAVAKKECGGFSRLNFPEVST